MATVRVVFVSARFAPMDTTGTIRVNAITERLPTYDVEPIVVTIPLPWVAQQGAVAPQRLEAQPNVVRPTSRLDKPTIALSRVPGARRLLRWLLRPDILQLWAALVPRTVINQVPRPDVVFATGPPFTALALGRRLAKHWAVPLVAEFRDPPTLDRSTGRAGTFGRWRTRRDLVRTVRAADRVISVTASVKDFLTSVGADPQTTVVIPNSAPTWSSTHPLEVVPRSRHVTLTYAGSLRGPADWNLLAALAETLMDIDADGTIRLVGHHNPPQDHPIQRHIASGTVSLIGRVSREAALLEMARADASLVFVGESEQWWIGRKVLESLGVARSLLAFAPSGEVADLLRRSTKSQIIDRASCGPKEMKAALDRIAVQRRVTEPVVGPEPSVPNDTEMTELIVRVLRAAVEGRPSPADWSW